MKKTLLALSLGMALPLTAVHAEISFNGFANIVAGKASSGDTQWGYDDDVDFKQGSLFALQASTDLTEGLSATVQIISRGVDDWETEFEWAYLAYDVNDQTRILLGRQRAPMYMFSDYLDVSYAYPWISPPQGVYDLELSTFDGISANYSFTLGEFDANAQAFFGSESNEIEVFGEAIESEFEQITGASFTFNRDWLTLRAAYLTTDLNLPAPGSSDLIAAWQTVPGFETLGDEATIMEEQSKFAELGVQVDYNNWLFIAEYTHIDYDQMPLDTEESMFATLGYRFDTVLVHATYGQDENDVNGNVNNLPYGVNPELDRLSTLTEQAFRFREQDSSYYTLGARWDFHDSAALKVEFSRRDNDLLNEDTNLIRTALVTVF